MNQIFKKTLQLFILCLAIALDVSCIDRTITPHSIGIGISVGEIDFADQKATRTDPLEIECNYSYHCNENLSLSFDIRTEPISLAIYTQKNTYDLIQSLKNPQDLNFDALSFKKKSSLMPRAHIQIFPFVDLQIYISCFAEYHKSVVNAEYNVYKHDDNTPRIQISDKGFRYGFALGYNSIKHTGSGFGLSFESGVILYGSDLQLKIDSKLPSGKPITHTESIKFGPTHYCSMKFQYKF